MVQLNLFKCTCLIITTFAVAKAGLFFNKYTTRFCYNSPNVTITSQCVYCNYFAFDSTVLACTGTTALTVNMTSTQAFCVIANCLSQIKQIPIFLGRKKRNVDTSNKGQERGQLREVSSEGLIELIESNESNESNLTSTEAPAIPESTTQVIEFNLNGKNERFIVARQVTVEVLPSEPTDDLDLESVPLINNSSNSLFDY